MLKQINIKNFAIIDALELNFSQGMIVLTGETGAGKSIIIDAIELALGQRASADLVKNDAERADISLIFEIQNDSPLKDFLKEREFDSFDEHCIIRRVIHRDGRSKSTLNDIPVTQQTLRTLSEFLINIHGQHEFQTLLKREQQQRLVDSFARHNTLVDQVKKRYTQWQDLQMQYQTLLNQTQERQAQAEFLAYQIQELDQLNLTSQEWIALNEEHQQLANADLLLNQCQIALNSLDCDDIPSSTELLNRTQHALQSIESITPALKNASQNIDQALLQVIDAKTDIQHFLDKLDLNTERLQQVEQRLRDIHDMARKHHVLPEELFDLHQRLSTELKQYQNRDTVLQTLTEEIKQIETQYFEVAHKLSQSRKSAAQKFAEQVSAHIQKLGMPQGHLEVAITSLDNHVLLPYGLEKLEFFISANPGQPLKPLTQVASGGELSRISLAIHVITGQNERIPTLIFDEIDMGIGGITADIVGTLLRTLGQATQVFCITHLPQIASKGHHHLFIEKHSTKKKTSTTVSWLDQHQRIQEIARMVGGIHITKQTLAHAQEMLENRSQ